jgi:predicted nucleic acid-binding protein
MTSSSNPQVERGLDAMLIVYSLLNGHPASTVCEQFIRAHTGWFTTTFTLFETKAVLTKVYTVDAALSSQKVGAVCSGTDYRRRGRPCNRVGCHEHGRGDGH